MLPLVSLMTAVLIGAAAFSADYGALFFAKRKTQTAADMAALAAASFPSDAGNLARQSLGDNGLPDWTTLSVETGHYAPDSSVSPASRFQSGGSPVNAARVKVTRMTMLVLSRVLSGQTQTQVGASALAAKTELASFTVGTRAVGLQNGIANALLGAMLGTKLSLSVMDYNALAGANVDAFQFLDALATSLSLQTVTYSQVLQSQATVGQIAAAFATAAQRGGSGLTVTSALQQVASGLVSATNRVPVARMLSLGDLGQGLVGSQDPTQGLPVNAMDFLSALAELCNGTRQVQVDLGPSIPGLASTKLTVAVGDRPQSATGVGPVGLTVQTAQTRLLLETRVNAPLGLGQIYLPIYVSIAGATGTLTALTCPWSSHSGLDATIAVQPGLVDAAVANVSPASIQASGPGPDLGTAATLVQLPLLGVTGQARVKGASPAAQVLDFMSDDIATQRVKTVTTTGIAGSVAAGLVGNLSLNVNVVGLGLGLPDSTTRNTLTATLTAVAPALDGVLDSALRSLGIGLGQADTWVNAVRCDRAVLVQ